jgi:hypothetical protein
METYPLDIDLAQVLRWLKRESEVCLLGAIEKDRHAADGGSRL